MVSAAHLLDGIGAVTPKHAPWDRAAVAALAIGADVDLTIAFDGNLDVLAVRGEDERADVSVGDDFGNGHCFVWFGVGSRVVQLGRQYARCVKSTSFILRKMRNSFFRPERGPLNKLLSDP